MARGALALVLNLNPDLNLNDLKALEIKRKIKITIKKLAKDLNSMAVGIKGGSSVRGLSSFMQR